MLQTPSPNPDAADCSPRFTVDQEGGRTTIQLVAQLLPFEERLGVRLILTIWFGMTATFTAGMLWIILRGDRREMLSLLFIAPYWVLGFALLRWHLCRMQRRAILTITPEELSVAESSFFGVRDRHWPRMDLVDIQFGRPGSCLYISARSQKPARVLQNIYESDLRWLAKTLRHLLQINPPP